jgi:hypothetical protein
MEMLLDAVAPGISVSSANHDQVSQKPLHRLNEDGSEVVQPRDGDDQLPLKRQQRTNPTLATHQCSICARSYERVDRLSRHMRTHENARRYLCHRCQKSFNRADLLARHMMTHSRNDAGAVPGHKGIHRTDRAGQACVGCAAAKARCENQKPCRRCQLKNITCEVTNQNASDSRRQLSTFKGSETSSRSTASPGQNTMLQQQNPQQQQQEQDVGGTTVTDPEPAIFVEEHHSIQEVERSADPSNATENGVVHSGLISEAPMLAQLEIYDMHSMPMNDNQLAFDNIMNELLFMPIAADFNNQNLDINFHDFSFQDDPMEVFPMPNRVVNNGETAVVDVVGPTPRTSRDVRAGYAAFTRSPWLWTPTALDCALRDGENLTLDDGSVTSTLTPRSSGMIPNVPSCGFPTIRPALRDKMHHLLSTMTKYASRIPDFPSIDVINHIVEAFFVRQTYQIDNWIHVPSIALSDTIPELALALVIAGSTVIAVPAVWKMGLVLQDVARMKLGELVRILSVDCGTMPSDPCSGSEKIVLRANCSLFKHGCFR